MSVEQFVISALVEEGSPKRAFQASVSTADFEIYDEEWQWIIRRAENRKPINPRIFKKAFPDFEFIRQRENIGDLLDELKSERAYIGVTSAIDEAIAGEDPLSQENALEKAMQLREILGEVVRAHGGQSDVLIKSGWADHYQRVKGLKTLLESGHNAGIPTGIPHF